MVNNPFYDRMNSLSKEELFDVLVHHKDYNPQAIEAAVQVCKEKNYVGEFKALSDELEKQADLEKRSEEEQAGKLQDINLSNRIRFSISTGNQINFEGQLIRHNINFYKSEGYNVEALVMNYYFSDKDFPIAKTIAAKANTP